ncbi:hypothetical protein ACWDWS_33180 [Streptomyces sp. NPDC003328]
MAPAVLDRYLARTGFNSQQTSRRLPTGASNLFEPVDQPQGSDHGAHGIFDEQSHSWSLEAFLSRHPAAAASGLALGIAALAAAWLDRRTRMA